MCRNDRYERDETICERYALMAPTAGAIDMSLSFRMTISRLSDEPALFIAS
jgi:hypothetical protein